MPSEPAAADRTVQAAVQGRAEDGYGFTNWSESLSFTARTRVCPADEDEVVEVVRRAAEAGDTVRPVGSGHSSTPVMATEDVLVSLERLDGVVADDTDHDTDESGTALARVLPGTGLEDLGRQLEEQGLGPPNLGDVDYQAIAGAIGTGTHGTGETLGNLSSALAGGRLVTGAGEVVPFGVDAGEAPDSPLTRAAQVSLGALGIFTSLTLRVRPAYDLHRRNHMTHIDWVLDHFDDLAARYRHVDFYWYPRSDLAQVRVLDEPGQLDDLDVPGQLQTESTGPSWEVIPNDRQLKFDEMEYMLPREAGLEVFRTARDRIKERHRATVGWRVLVRTVAADRAMLSNAQDRPTMTIALLHNNTLDHTEYFSDMEPLFLDHGGRPHWGKKHSRTAEHLRPMYPEWDDFAALRRKLDPGGVLLNDHLRSILGEED